MADVLPPVAEEASTSTGMNFKAMATKKAGEIQIKQVQLTGSVAMKILQHCTETDPSAPCGQLLGMDVGSILECTEAFPFLVRILAVLAQRSQGLHAVADRLGVEGPALLCEARYHAYQ